MAIYTVSEPCEDISGWKYSFITIGGKKYRVVRSSPAFGDLGYGTVEVDGQIYSVYRAKRKDGDIGYGVVEIEKKAKKKPLRYHARQLPEDLDEIVNAWPELPENIKAKMKELVKNHRT